MALETGTFISDLVATNPVGSDPLAFADDHIRLVKSTIKNTFPNISGAVTKTHTEINTAVDQAAAALPRAGGTMTGAITLAGNASADLHAVPRQQVISLIQAMYPVGSVYINASSTANPSVLLGFGTWVEFGSGRVLVGQNTGDTAFDSLEETGGSSTTSSSTPSMTASSTDLSIPTSGYATAASGAGTTPTGYMLTGSGRGEIGETLESVGWTNGSDRSIGSHTHTISGGAHTHSATPPYIVVKMWKRTA